jgi:hypothetical protein
MALFHVGKLCLLTSGVPFVASMATVSMLTNEKIRSVRFCQPTLSTQPKLWLWCSEVCCAGSPSTIG